MATEEINDKFENNNLLLKWTNQFSRTILNDYEPDIENFQKIKNIEELVRLLLSELLEQLILNSNDVINKNDVLTHFRSAEIKSIIYKTGSLKLIKNINFTNIEETTSFLINLFNLMWIHALLLSDKEQNEYLLTKNWFERQRYSNSVGYVIGQLGFISLYDLRSALLNFPEVLQFNKILKSFVISNNSRIVFAVAVPYSLSPKITVIDFREFDSLLKVLEKEYIQRHTIKHCDQLIVSMTLIMYIEQIIRNCDVTIEPKENSNLKSTKLDILRHVFAELNIPFTELLSKDIYTIVNTEFVIRLKYTDLELKYFMKCEKYVWKFCCNHDSIYDCITYYVSMCKAVQFGNYYSSSIKSSDDSCMNDIFFKLSKILPLLIKELNLRTYSANDTLNCLCSTINFVNGFTEDTETKLENDSYLPDVIQTTSLTSSIDHICNKIKFWLKIIEMGIVTKLFDWNNMFSASADDVLINILEFENVELAYEWVSLHSNVSPINSFSIEVYSKYIMFLLIQREKNNRNEFLEKSLNSLNNDLIIDICDYLIRNDHSTEKLIIILTIFMNVNYIDKIEKRKYIALLFGLFMISLIPESEKVNFLDIIYSPMLIIEQLILNKNIVILKKLLKELSSFVRTKPEDVQEFHVILKDEIDELLKSYALQSLNFRKKPSVMHQKNAALLRAAIHKDEECFNPPVEVPSISDWIPNNLANACIICDVPFSVFTRRHHCRRCGRVICGTCSTKRIKVATYKNVVRVCSQCYEFENQYGLHDESVSQTSTIISEENSKKTLWKLSTNQEVNDEVRKRAQFDNTPDVELCMSVLELHSENINVPRFLFSKTDYMLKILRQRLVCPANFDYSEVTHVVRSLLLASKLYYTHLGEFHAIHGCEERIKEIDLLNQLVEIRCFPVKSTKPIHNVTELIKIRDILLEQQQWDLALDISTKIGVECNSIWYMWGKNLLKSGDWLEARDKFLRSSLRKNSAMLMDILKILYSNVNSESPRRFVTFFKMSPKKTEIPEKIYEEALYYLQTYGSTKQLFEFYVKNNRMFEAVGLTFSKKISAKLFLENIYIPHLKNNDYSKIHKMMETFDKTLVEWKDYINKMCVYCNKNNHFEELYEIQCWTNDHFRAAISCIMFYKSNITTYSDIKKNEFHLQNAINHLKLSLQQTNGNALIKNVEPPEIERFLNTARLQVEISELINDNVTCSNIKMLPVPTLFDGEIQKIELISLLYEAVNDMKSAFNFTNNLIVEYSLDKTQVYTHVSRKMVEIKAETRVFILINYIKELIPDSQQLIDSVVVSTIKAKPMKPELFLNCISDPLLKIDMHIESGWLKTGYVLAVKQNKLEYIEKIYNEAKKLNMPAIERICATKLGLYKNNGSK